MRDNNKAFEKKKADYWKTRLADSGCDRRRLWRHVDNVLCRCKAGLSPAPVSHTADDFQRFFAAKVDAVRAATAVGSTAVSTDAGTSQFTKPSQSTMTTWREVTPAEVRRTILAALVKSCSLDPVSTYLLPDCIDESGYVALSQALTPIPNPHSQL